jgi:hypothetical protein
VHGGATITPDMADEMHELVFHTTVAQASPELAMEILGLLLELNVLEDEECILRQRIQEMVGASPPKRASQQQPSLFSGDSDGLVLESKGNFFHCRSLHNLLTDFFHRIES